MSSLYSARFFTSAAQLANLPTLDVPEVCFAGRSNAGKSSAINLLANQKQLAYASKTPGRTRLINFFAIRGEEPDSVAGFLVDLPGYGYAQISETERRQWDQLLGTYIARRKNLAAMVLIMDARRPLLDLDLAMINWFAPTGKPMLMLLTKADKLTRNESTAALRQVTQFLEEHLLVDRVKAQLFSSLKRTGLESAMSVVESFLRPADANPEPDPK